MKLLVDMNLSPSWVERLAGHGFEAVHWIRSTSRFADDRLARRSIPQAVHLARELLAELSEQLMVQELLL